MSAPTPEQAAREEMRQALAEAPPTPSGHDILDDIEAALGGIISDLREERATRGPTADYFRGVAELARTVDRIRGLAEALGSHVTREAGLGK